MAALSDPSASRLEDSSSEHLFSETTEAGEEERKANVKAKNMDHLYETVQHESQVNALYIETIRTLMDEGDYESAAIYQDALNKNLFLGAHALATLEDTNKTHNPLASIVQHNILESRSNPWSESNACALPKNSNKTSNGERAAGKPIIVPSTLDSVVIPSVPTNTGKWTDEEHDKCMEATERWGRKQYGIIAKFIGGTRTTKQVRDHLAKHDKKIARRKAKEELLAAKNRKRDAKRQAAAAKLAAKEASS